MSEYDARAAPGMPEHGTGHDLREWGYGIACPRCGQWGIDHVDFGACGEQGDEGCAPARYPDQPPRGGLPGIRAQREYEANHPPLCGRGAPGVIDLASAVRYWRTTHRAAACLRCRAAFGGLPPLPDAAHDARLLPAADGAACAVCGVAAASADALGAICDGGRVLAAISGQRAGHNRAWLPTVHRRPQHVRTGCASSGAGYPRVLKFGDGLASNGLREALRMRVTCAHCRRAIAKAPALPA